MSDHDLNVKNLGLALEDVFSSRRGNIADALFAIADALDEVARKVDELGDYKYLCSSLDGIASALNDENIAIHLSDIGDAIARNNKSSE
jgi:hypothetical protein